MRTFILQRDVDETGISGTGAVAEGVEFSDGSAALRWRSHVSSTAVYASIDAVNTVHGHGGKTRVVITGSSHPAMCEIQADREGELWLCCHDPDCTWEQEVPNGASLASLADLAARHLTEDHDDALEGVTGHG